MTEFKGFPKIPRLFRNVIVTEKIDGTNAIIRIENDGVTIQAGSRNRWITPEDDNNGFAKWVEANKDELLKLGPGNHFGEWFGAGIQRKYGLTEKRFALFQSSRWTDDVRPACCGVVPVLAYGTDIGEAVRKGLDILRAEGSRAVPGFMNPEGVVAYHTASGQMFKATLDADHLPKGQA